MLRCFVCGGDDAERRTSYGHSFGEQDPSLEYWHDPVRRRQSKSIHEHQGAIPAHIKAAAAAAEAAVMEKFKANQKRRLQELEQQSQAWRQQQAALAAWNAAQQQHHQLNSHRQAPSSLTAAQAYEPQQPSRPAYVDDDVEEVPVMQHLGTHLSVGRESGSFATRAAVVDTADASSSDGDQGVIEPPSRSQPYGGGGSSQASGQRVAGAHDKDDDTGDDDDDDDNNDDFTDTESSEASVEHAPAAGGMSADVLAETRRVEDAILAKFRANKAAREAAAAASAGRSRQ